MQCFSKRCLLAFTENQALERIFSFEVATWQSQTHKNSVTSMQHLSHVFPPSAVSQVYSKGFSKFAFHWGWQYICSNLSDVLQLLPHLTKLNKHIPPIRADLLIYFPEYTHWCLMGFFFTKSVIVNWIWLTKFFKITLSTYIENSWHWMI